MASIKIDKDMADTQQSFTQKAFPSREADWPLEGALNKVQAILSHRRSHAQDRTICRVPVI